MQFVNKMAHTVYIMKSYYRKSIKNGYIYLQKCCNSTIFVPYFNKDLKENLINHAGQGKLQIINHNLLVKGP